MSPPVEPGPIRLRPTRRGLAVATVFVVAVVTAVGRDGLPSPAARVLLGGLLGLGFVGALGAWLTLRRVRLVVLAPERAVAGRAAPGRVRVHGVRALVRVAVPDARPVFPESDGTYDTRWLLPSRGIAPIGPAVLHTTAPLGLFAATATVPVDGVVVVWPSPEPHDAPPVVPEPDLGPPRPARLGDRIRDVAVRPTLRAGRPVVRDRPRSAAAPAPCLDVDADDDREAALGRACAALLASVRGGPAPDVVVDGVRWPGRRDPEAVRAVLDALARARRR
jgi:uncharacterized protein (DUF58 family)